MDYRFFGQGLVLEPKSFEDLDLAVAAIHEGQFVIVNVAGVEDDEAQRMVDFLCGVIYAAEGYQEKVGERVFVFTPPSIYLSHGDEEELPPPR